MNSDLPERQAILDDMGSIQTEYDLVVVGSGFAGTMTTLNFLEQCKKLGKKGKVALIEAGREGERCGASRWYDPSLLLSHPSPPSPILDYHDSCINNFKDHGIPPTR